MGLFMTVDDLKKFYGVENNYQLAKRLKKGRTTIKQWDDGGIPIGVQAIFELLTGGRVKADRKLLFGFTN
ncbi:TPA: hypothetical protein JIU02_07545 [Acinetobacter baumannii]|nr:hypothetical protein [Acinetobacter baumannii]HAV3088064.1 hypothetical protein [Acinetobacter baumannii]HAV4624518.1 hypothetical protein [Acinetobacter baumannii]HAV4638663.1 hypothetical protein [Acinetobacter baumannii]HAV4649388.1 hypothetical protein [Acinetobacter baumannii]